MPKKKTPVRNPWTKEDLRQLKAHSKTRTPVVEVAKAMKRTEAAVRQKAKTIGYVVEGGLHAGERFAERGEPVHERHELLEFVHQSPLHHDARRILVVRRHQLIIEARKFPAKTLAGNDPAAHFRTFALDEPQVVIFFDKQPTITRCHRPCPCRRFR